MPQIASYDDVKANRIKRELPVGQGWRTNFLAHPEGADVTEEPMGFLVEGNHERVIRPHFHENDQFQVVVSGGGVLGKHKLSIHAVHFSRAAIWALFSTDHLCPWTGSAGPKEIRPAWFVDPKIRHAGQLRA